MRGVEVVMDKRSLLLQSVGRSRKYNDNDHSSSVIGRIGRDVHAAERKATKTNAVP